MNYPLTQAQHAACIESIKRIVSIPSVLDEQATDTPFGQAIQTCLEETLEICQSMGLETYLDTEGYYGYAEYGDGDTTFAVLCHLDVVPASQEFEWRYPPFEPTIYEQKLYGRGTQDDKGPTCIALHALKALIDAGYQFNKKVRFIFGTDEETLWRCMDRYRETEQPADLGFAPDAKFPLIFAEKGLLQFYIEGSGSADISIDVGGALNVVPDTAAYQGDRLEKVKQTLDKLGYAYTETEDGIDVLGESIHSKDAPQGVNAVTRLATALGHHIDHPILRFLADELKEDATAETLFGSVSDEASGGLTFNVAKLMINADEAKIGVDMRIPVTYNKDELIDTLQQRLEAHGLSYHEFDYLPSLYVPKDDVLVQTLLKVYRQRTGDQTEPISSGGATYARMMDQCVCFGARLPETPDLAHQVNEYLTLDNIYEAMEIYAETFKQLVCQPVE